MKQTNVTVFGDGAFGTAFATVLARNEYHVTLWCKNADVAKAINRRHENTIYLPGIMLQENITATTSLEQACANQIIFQAIPMMFLRDVFTQAKRFLHPDQIFISLTKGIEITDNHVNFATEIIEELSGSSNTVVISGPSYAHELATQQPTGLVIASNNHELAHTVQKIIDTDSLITNISSDVTGIQIIAALKNVCALGIGILEGAGYRNNTQVLFIIKVLEEMKNVLRAYDVPETAINQTLYGLAGIGDLMLTCFGKSSRNYRFGVARAAGKSYDAIVAEMGIAPEGVNTLRALPTLAKQHRISIPLFLSIHTIVFEKANVHDLIQKISQ